MIFSPKTTPFDISPLAEEQGDTAPVAPDYVNRRRGGVEAELEDGAGAIPSLPREGTAV
jgi:hypothetical protein